jgi:hypothetical protein
MSVTLRRYEASVAKILQSSIDARRKYGIPERTQLLLRYSVLEGSMGQWQASFRVSERVDQEPDGVPCFLMKNFGETNFGPVIEGLMRPSIRSISGAMKENPHAANSSNTGQLWRGNVMKTNVNTKKQNNFFALKHVLCSNHASNPFCQWLSPRDSRSRPRV